MQRVLFTQLKTPTHLPHVHITRLGGEQTSFLHDHDFHEFFLVLSGRGVHHINGDRVEVSAGDLVSVLPGDAHCYSTGAGEHLTFVNVALSAEWWRCFECVCALQGARTWRSARLGPAEGRRMASMVRGLATVRDPAVLLRVVKDVDERIRASKPVSAGRPPEWLEAMRETMFASPELLQKPLGYWQRASGVSAEHLSRSCRRHYGMSLREMIQRARVEQAKYLLRTTDYKVVRVAYDAGFHNLSNFHRTFAKLTGQTPDRWRTRPDAAVPRRR